MLKRMAIIMKFLVYLTLTAGVFAAGSCDNPLFAVANWPSDLPRPRYLTTPQDVTNSTFCTKFQSGSTQTCCNKDTIQDIVSMFQSRRDKMKEKGEGIEGGVRDTFNDFDPDNQKTKGAGRILATGGPPANSTKPRELPLSDGTEYAASGTKNSSNHGPPPKEDNPAGFDNVDVPNSNLTSASSPQGRGKEKKRGWVLKMSTAGQEAFKNITRSMNALMKQFAHTMGKCMAAQLKHLAGMMCMGCDPDWASWVSGTTSSITVSLATDACTELTDACLDFVTQAQSLPALIEGYKASLQAVIDSEIAAGTITASDVSTTDLSSLTKPSTSVTPVCTTTDSCKTYICETMSKGKTGVAPDPNTVADPASVSTTSSGRELATSVTYQFTSSGYNSVSLGDAATSSSVSTSTDGALIDGVSTTSSPLDTSTSAAATLAVLAAGFILVL